MYSYDDEQCFQQVLSQGQGYLDCGKAGSRGAAGNDAAAMAVS